MKNPIEIELEQMIEHERVIREMVRILVNGGMGVREAVRFVLNPYEQRFEGGK